MKFTYLLLLTLGLANLLFAQNMNCITLKDKSGIAYQKGSTLPFTGHCVQYNTNGKPVFEGTYKNGLVCGECKWYYPNGRPKQTVTYVLNKDNVPVVDGKTTEWFDNGNLQRVLNYKNGQQDGKWYELDKKRNVIKQGVYKRGMLVSGDQYNPPAK